MIGLLAADVPVQLSNECRAEMTARCRDADAIPKVEGAGTVVIENDVAVQIMHNGVRVLAGGYYGDWMQELIERLRGHHEPQEEAVFHAIMKHLPPQATMLELGGYWSYYSLWFMHEHPAARRALVIEPDPNHLSVGRRNAGLNGYAIAFTQGVVGATSDPEVPFATETTGEIRVPMICVPDFLAANAIGTLDVLHADVQGAEVDVLRSCETVLRAGQIRFVIVSTHSHVISGDPLTHQSCLALLREFGGRILAEHDVHESFSGDGLIVAYFGREPLDWTDVPLSYNRYSTSFFRNPLFDLSQAWDERAAREASA